MAAFASFHAHFQRGNNFTPFVWKASEEYLKEFTTAKYKYSEKFYNQKFSFLLKTKEMLIRTLN